MERDYLKIFKPDGSVYWDGVIKLRSPRNTSMRFMPANVSIKKWELAFYEKYKAELTEG